jgi:hypothetical protein
MAGNLVSLRVQSEWNPPYAVALRPQVREIAEMQDLIRDLEHPPPTSAPALAPSQQT